MSWSERTDLRTKKSKTWQDDSTGRLALHASLADIHYKVSPDEEGYSGTVDMAVNRVNNAQFDGWRATGGEWHYALGTPQGKQEDGWVGFGGQRGSKWALFRLSGAGYLHWPTKQWTAIGGEPTYNRSNLSVERSTVQIGPSGQEEQINAGAVVSWAGLWSTPGGGDISVNWKAANSGLKEEVVLNQAARLWLAANAAPATAATETFFGFLFELDMAQISKLRVGESEQQINGDFWDDSRGVQLRGELDELIAFMPVDELFVRADDGLGGVLEVESVRLRKRFFRSQGKNYLLVGIRFDVMSSLQAGDLVFDPTITPSESAGSDDAQEKDDGTAFTSAGLSVDMQSGTSGSTRYNGGFRYQVNIAAGSTIDTAYATNFNPTSAAQDNPTVTFYFEDVDDAADFSTTADVTSRTTTTASVDWTTTNVTSSTNSPSLVSPIQEVVDRAGWASGQYMVMLVKGRNAANTNFKVFGYDNSAADPPTLYIEYTEAATGHASKLVGSIPLASKLRALV